MILHHHTYIIECRNFILQKITNNIFFCLKPNVKFYKAFAVDIILICRAHNILRFSSYSVLYLVNSAIFYFPIFLTSRVQKEKICAHVTAKCANCEKNYTTNSLQCTSMFKANIEAKERKKVKG